jgi:phosphate transport system protein
MNTQPLAEPRAKSPEVCSREPMVGPSTHHRSHDFDADIHVLRERLMAMSARCQEQLRVAIDAFWSGSRDRLGDIEESERVIDRDEKAIGALVLRILALRQPVASDLRLLTASFRLVTDLERIGDEAADLARTSVSSLPDGEAVRQRLQRMAEKATTVLRTALESFFSGDAKVAAEARGAEREVEAAYDDVLGAAVAFMTKQPALAASGLSCITGANCLERIVHHVTNIAEGTLFIAAGEHEMPR